MSTAELIVSYLRERARVRLFAPLALLLALVAWRLTPSAEFNLGVVLTAAVRALALVLAFRVWDDLEDRATDRAHHPERVMARSARTAPFVILALLLALSACASLTQNAEPIPRFIALALATGTLSLWYAARPSENWNRVAGGLIVLLKYPLIAYAVAPSLPPVGMSARTIGLLGGLYVLVCLYEYADDPKLRLIFTSRRSLP